LQQFDFDAVLKELVLLAGTAARLSWFSQFLLQALDFVQFVATSFSFNFAKCLFKKILFKLQEESFGFIVCSRD